MTATIDAEDAWRVVGHTCAHNERLLITGPDPNALLLALGCGCEAGAA